MEEWSDWIVDNDPAEMIQQMRGVLADRRRSHEDKIEALTLLTNIADEASVDVLRWYHEHADPGLELTALLALMEATRLNRPPTFAPWHDALLERIHEVGEVLTTLHGKLPDRHAFQAALVIALREDGFRVEERGRALLKYDGHLIDLAALDLVLNNQMLLGFWDQADQADALQAMEEDEESDEEEPDPMERFYTTLRAANLPWGIQIDISGDTLLTDIVANVEVDRGTPRVEYVLAMPQQ